MKYLYICPSFVLSLVLPQSALASVDVIVALGRSAVTKGATQGHRNYGSNTSHGSPVSVAATTPDGVSLVAKARASDDYVGILSSLSGPVSYDGDGLVLGGETQGTDSAAYVTKRSLLTFDDPSVSAFTMAYSLHGSVLGRDVSASWFYSSTLTAHIFTTDLNGDNFSFGYLNDITPPAEFSGDGLVTDKMSITGPSFYFTEYWAASSFATVTPGVVLPASTSTGVDFYDTAALLGFVAYDSAGNRLSGVHLTNEDGYVYREIQAVPEPTSWVPVGLSSLYFLKRRRASERVDAE